MPRDEAARLVAQAVQGDLSAFESLYRSHVGRVYALCMRMLGDPDGAQRVLEQAQSTLHPDDPDINNFLQLLRAN